MINFHFETPVSLLNRKPLKVFLLNIFKRERKDIEQLDYIFCSDEYLLGINKQFLQHDYYTDIISFNLSPGNSEAIIGEIYISANRVRENAQQFRTSFKAELHRVIFHGVLHLCGYKDKTKTQKMEMRKMEDFYLGLYFNK
jgi:probable rRNA maturation factor